MVGDGLGTLMDDSSSISEISDCTFSRCVTGHNDNGTLVLTAHGYHNGGNHANGDGGALSLLFTAIVIVDSHFVGCRAADYGGAIYGRNSVLHLVRVSLDSCQALWKGGGVALVVDDEITSSIPESRAINATIDSCVAGTLGANGIVIAAGTTVYGSIRTPCGGGVHLQKTNLSARGTTVARCQAGT